MDSSDDISEIDDVLRFDSKLQAASPEHNGFIA
jgi:hypothetical protein